VGGHGLSVCHGQAGGFFATDEHGFSGIIAFFEPPMNADEQSCDGLGKSFRPGVESETFAAVAVFDHEYE